MSNCSRCGFKLPEDAVFCPNCGASVKRIEEKRVVPSDSIANQLRLSLIGAFLSMIISFSVNIPLYFIPSFISSLVIIYLSGTRRLKDAALIAMMVYLFADAIITGIFLGSLYITRQELATVYGDYVPTLIDTIMYFISPVTALAAGYIGSKIALKKEEERVHAREEGYILPLYKH